MSLIQNERTKLTATLLNNTAMTFIAAGVITPLIAYFYGMGSSAPVQIGRLGLGAVIWFSTGIGIHFAARRLLGGLKP